MSNHHTLGPCHRCGRSGHVARECSLHVCFRCNGRGHMAWECVEGVTCSRCGEKGHLQRNCRNVSCHKCGRKGHISKFCNDPFIKAEEVERNERHQAFLKSRVASGQGSCKGGLTSLTVTVSGPTGSQMVAPGPWDGLGNVANSLETQVCGVCLRKPSINRSQFGVLGNVKILRMKRKSYPEAKREDAKRRPDERCGNFENTKIGNPVETSSRRDTSKVDDPSQWNCLLCYGSDDSIGGSPVSGEGLSVEQNRHPQEGAQMDLKFISDETKDSRTDLPSTVGKESSLVEEGDGSATGLPPNPGKLPTSVDVRNDSETDLQLNVEQEPENIDERSFSGTGLPSSPAQLPTSVDVRNGSETDLQPNVEQKPENIDERSFSGTGLPSSPGQLPTSVDVRNGSETDLQSNVEQEPHNIDERDFSGTGLG